MNDSKSDKTENIKILDSKILEDVSIDNQYNSICVKVHCVELYGKKFAYTTSEYITGAHSGSYRTSYDVSRLIPID